MTAAVEESQPHDHGIGLDGRCDACDPAPSVVDQEPVAPAPTLCGTFAVYPLPDGTAGLVLDVQGEPEPRRMLLPKLVVDMVLHGQRPSAKDAMAFFMGRK